jgi:uncharacterized protein (TIGR03000 family)
MAAVITAGGTTTPAWGWCGSCGSGYGGGYGGGGGYTAGNYPPGPYGFGYSFGGCHGYSYGGGGCYGYFSTPGQVPLPLRPPETATPDKDKGKSEKPDKETRFPKQGRVLVQLPPDAKLYVDGEPVNLTPNIRNILTPELTPGRAYYYTVKAVAVRDGQTVEDTRRLVVRAGQVSQVDFRDLGVVKQEAPQAQPAHVTVHLPEGARLYVDGVAQRGTAGKRTFDTPKLEPGKSYYYTFKAELGGANRADTRRVVVQAGKDVTVDFRDVTVAATER